MPHITVASSRDDELQVVIAFSNNALALALALALAQTLVSTAYPYLIATVDSEEVLGARTQVSDSVREEGLLGGGGLGGAFLRSPAALRKDPGVGYGGNHAPVGGAIPTQLQGVGEDRGASVRERVACDMRSL